MKNEDVRFSGIARLFSREGLDRLRRSHVCVVGVGGVGSWAVEALARSGIGELTLVDMDDICVSNVNRQLHALDGEFGKPKVEVMAQRARAINPDCVVHPLQSFFLRSNAQEILQPGFSYLLDAIDSPSKKCLLIDMCRDKKLPVITVGSSGGRRDPTAVRVMDLAFTSHDRLLQEIRKKLRVRHGFPRGLQPFNVDCVCSVEPPVYPVKDGSVCVQRGSDTDLRLDCNSGYGTASFVTGTFGLVAVAHVVQKLASASTVSETPSKSGRESTV
ncbi:MAG: tRNA threonylcarbamoyladenosine dehydratase [Pedosphaera sp.]|nr:tRNA threonylcarbamoyladenosine dehydratase [Pedosphaera sp.]